MNKKSFLIGAALCLAAFGCSNTSDTAGNDMGSGGGDMGIGGGDLGQAGDMAASSGGATLDVIAGPIGGFGNADGTGPAARFTDLQGIAWDGNSSLYAINRNGLGIRKITLPAGTVSTLPMTTIGGVTLVSDHAGALYRVLGSKVEKYDIAMNTITLVAGAGAGSADGIGSAARFSSPGALALDGKGNLFVADTGNHTIRQIVLATGAVTTLAGMSGMSGTADGTGSVARFKSPQALAADGAGNLYVADTGNYTIRQIDIATGAVTTIAGLAGTSGFADGVGNMARFFSCIAMVHDGQGTLYFVESLGSVRQMDVATNSVTTLAGKAGLLQSVDDTGANARFSLPATLTLDGSGNLYVGDSYTVRKVVVATGVVTTIAGQQGAIGSTDGTATAARFQAPIGVTFAAGNLFVADNGNDVIRQIDFSTGAVTTLAGLAFLSGSTDGTGSTARFNQPNYVTADGNGNLYVSDTANDLLRKIVVSTRAVTTLAGSAGSAGNTDGTGAAALFNFPYGITPDKNGNLYVADANNSTIRQIVAATGVVTTLAGTAGVTGSTDGIGPAARFKNAYDLIGDGAGSLYIADTGNCRIRKLDIASATVTTVAGGCGAPKDGIGVAARFNNPRNIAYDGAGNLYVSDAQTVRKIVIATAAVTTVVGTAGRSGVLLGPLPAGLNMPRGLAWVPNQGLVIIDYTENSILIARGL